MSTLVVLPSPATLVVEGATNQYLTMSGLRDLLRVTMRSPEAEAAYERDRWSSTEIYTCIQNGMGRVAPLVRVQEVLTFALTDGERDYQLPAYIQKVLSIRLRGWHQAVVVPDGTERSLAWKPTNDWRYVPSIWGNILHLNRSYNEEIDCEVTYERPLQIPPIPVSLGANIDGDDTEITVAVPTAFPVPGIVKIDDELILYEKLSAGGLTNLYRGAFGTLAAAHTTADTVDPVIPVEQGRGFPTIRLASELELLNLRLNDAGNTDTSRVLAQLQQKQADLVKLERQLVGSPAPGTISNLHSHRPRARRWVH